MNYHEAISARKGPIEDVYREAKHLSLSKFLEKIQNIIGSLTSVQIKVYTRIYARERR